MNKSRESPHHTHHTATPGPAPSTSAFYSTHKSTSIPPCSSPQWLPAGIHPTSPHVVEGCHDSAVTDRELPTCPINLFCRGPFSQPDIPTPALLHLQPIHRSQAGPLSSLRLPSSTPRPQAPITIEIPTDASRLTGGLAIRAIPGEQGSAASKSQGRSLSVLNGQYAFLDSLMQMGHGHDRQRIHHQHPDAQTRNNLA
jgi:hypothetical protein